MNTDPQAPPFWEQACLKLTELDPVWGKLIAAYPERALRSRGNPYETLARSLVGQQISVKAAEAVWGRLISRINTLSPDAIEAQTDESLRAVGLSGQKVKYLRALSEFELQGQLSLSFLEKQSDDEIVGHLCQIKGIGPWTAQMFLIFGLMRPDVWPVDDLGVRKGISLQFKAGAPVDRVEAIQFGEKIKPWRTVASWYLWRSLDPAVIDY